MAKCIFEILLNRPNDETDKILDGPRQLKIKDNQRLPRRFLRKPFLPQLQKGLFDFRLSIRSLECHEVTKRSEEKWKNEREDCLPAKFLSAPLAAARLHPDGEFIVFDDAADSTMLHTFLLDRDTIIFNISFDRNYVVQLLLSQRKLVNLSKLLCGISEWCFV